MRAASQATVDLDSDGSFCSQKDEIQCKSRSFLSYSVMQLKKIFKKTQSFFDACRSRMPEPSLPTRHRHGSTSRGSSSRGGRTNQYHPPSRSTHNGGRSIRPPSYSPMDEDSEQFSVDAIFSAHSDGLMVILRRAPWIDDSILLSNLGESPEKFLRWKLYKNFTCTTFHPDLWYSRFLLSSDSLSCHLPLFFFLGQEFILFPIRILCIYSIPNHCCCYFWYS